jgi:hypothetical protein
MSAGESSPPTKPEIVAGVLKYYRDEREVYRRHSEPLQLAMRELMAGYFKSDLLDTLRTITLRGVRIPPPPFYLQARAMSGGNFPDFVHLASVTYIDIIVFHERIELRTLFHGVVHAAQMAELGFQRYVELYVGGFMKYRSWTAIPLEHQAFQLEARFAADPTDKFSVEAEIRARLQEGRL